VLGNSRPNGRPAPPDDDARSVRVKHPVAASKPTDAAGAWRASGAAAAPSLWSIASIHASHSSSSSPTAAGAAPMARSNASTDAEPVLAQAFVPAPAT